MFPERYGNHILEFHVGKHMTTTVVTITNNKTNEILYRRDVDIWSPEKKEDYWFRNIVIDTNNNIWKYSVKSNATDIKYIIFTSYNGIEIWNDRLDIIYFLKIPEDKKYNDVYSFDIIDGFLYTWSSNNAKEVIITNFYNNYGEKYDKLVEKYDIIMNTIDKKLSSISPDRNSSVYYELLDEYPELDGIKKELLELDKLKTHDYIYSNNIPNNLMTKHMCLIEYT